MKYLYKFKSNHIFFSGFGLLLVWSGSGENFKSLAQVLAEIFNKSEESERTCQEHRSFEISKFKFKSNQKYFFGFGLVLAWPGSGENFKSLAQVLG